MSEIHVPVSISGGTYGTARCFKTSSGNTLLMVRGGASRRFTWCSACCTKATASR